MSLLFSIRALKEIFRDLYVLCRWRDIINWTLLLLHWIFIIQDKKQNKKISCLVEFSADSLCDIDRTVYNWVTDPLAMRKQKTCLWHSWCDSLQDRDCIVPSMKWNRWVGTVVTAPKVKTDHNCTLCSIWVTGCPGRRTLQGQQPLVFCPHLVHWLLRTGCRKSRQIWKKETHLYCDSRAL